MCSDLLFFCLISWLDSRQLRISCVHKGESNDGKLVVNLRAKVVMNLISTLQVNQLFPIHKEQLQGI